MKRILLVLITLLLIMLAFVEPVSAEVIEETIEVKVGEEFWIDIRDYVGENESFECQKKADWFGELDNGTIYGVPSIMGVYWLNITTDRGNYNIQIVVVNITGQNNVDGAINVPNNDINPSTWIMIISSVILAAFIIFLFFTDVGKWIFLHLYNKIKDLMKHKTRMEICNFINENPGVTRKTIYNRFDCSDTTIRYHLRRLEEGEEIKSERLGNDIRYWLYNCPRTEYDRLPVNEAKVLFFIDRNPNITQGELVIKTHLSKSAISRILQTLKDRGLITSTGNKQKQYLRIK